MYFPTYNTVVKLKTASVCIQISHAGKTHSSAFHTPSNTLGKTFMLTRAQLFALKATGVGTR